jgi:hypothetical protein
MALCQPIYRGATVALSYQPTPLQSAASTTRAPTHVPLISDKTDSVPCAVSLRNAKKCAFQSLAPPFAGRRGRRRTLSPGFRTRPRTVIAICPRRNPLSGHRPVPHPSGGSRYFSACRIHHITQRRAWRAVVKLLDSSMPFMPTVIASTGRHAAPVPSDSRTDWLPSARWSACSTLPTE